MVLCCRVPDIRVAFLDESLRWRVDILQSVGRSQSKVITMSWALSGGATFQPSTVSPILHTPNDYR